jgi:hypothetical protein
LGFADECEKVRAATVSGQRDFVAHIIGEDPRHSERVDGEAMYHIARSPMPDLLRCDVVASGPVPLLICVPAENNLIPSIARRRVTLAAGRIGRCLREPVIGPLKSPSLPGHLQWYVTDWRGYRPIRYRLDWSASLKGPAWTLEAGPTIETTSDIGRATRALKSKDKTPDGRPCRQLLAAVNSAQRDFRNTIGAVAETGSDLVLYNSSLPLMDFSVKVGIGGSTPNMLFAERTVPSPNLTRRQAEEMGGAASRALSACLQVRAERIADNSYDDGSVELVWRLADHYPPRPVSVFAVVRFEADHELVSRTAIRIQRKE